MKKFLSIILSIVMLMSLSVTAFAADIDSTNDGSNSASADVNGTYNPTVPTYTISYGTIENGTVVTDTGATEYKEGDPVTLTVTPASNYVLDTLTYTPENGSVTNITESEGVYGFTMPAANVTINATFKSTIVVAEITGLTIAVEGGSYDTDSNTYTVGNDATITVTLSGTNLDKYSENHQFKYSNTKVTIGQMTLNDGKTEATFTIKGSDLADESGAFQFYYTNDNWTNQSEGADGAKIQYQAPEISVSITWGGMSFTYDDTIPAGGSAETGWTCAEGANQVTVTNNGSQAVTASVTYTPEEAYKDMISGSFGDTTSAELENGESQVFGLTLSGKPTTALNNVKIGTVTVTITGNTLITDATTWQTAIGNGGNITLGANISTNSGSLIDGTTLDLNGHTLTKSGTSYEFLNVKGTVVLKDSSIDGTGTVVGASNGTGAVYVGTDDTYALTIEGGNYTGKYAVMAYGGTVTINGGTFEGTTASVFSYNRGTTITINGGNFKGALSEGNHTSIIVQGGTFDSDPTAYVDTNSYTVTNNNDGTWTVSATN